MVEGLLQPLNIFLLGLGGGFLIPLLHRLSKRLPAMAFWVSLAGMTLEALGEALHARRVSSVAATRCCLAEIERWQPRVNCFVTLDAAVPGAAHFMISTHAEIVARAIEDHIMAEASVAAE